MSLNKNDRNKFYNLVRTLQGNFSSQPIKELHTAVGAYYDEDILEGFAADAEYLGRHVGESSTFDNAFYKLCIEDNQYIFQLKEQLSRKIPPMSIQDLNKIIDNKMKMGKACDVYHLTSEHLKYLGQQARYVSKCVSTSR